MSLLSNSSGGRICSSCSQQRISSLRQLGRISASFSFCLISLRMRLGMVSISALRSHYFWAYRNCDRIRSLFRNWKYRQSALYREIRLSYFLCSGSIGFVNGWVLAARSKYWPTARAFAASKNEGIFSSRVGDWDTGVVNCPGIDHGQTPSLFAFQDSFLFHARFGLAGEALRGPESCPEQPGQSGRRHPELKYLYQQMLLRALAGRMGFMASTSTLATLVMQARYAMYLSKGVGFATIKHQQPHYQAATKTVHIKSFAQIDMPEGLKKKLVQAFPTTTQIQKQSVQLLLDGEDLIGIAKTGSGKTLAYSLPILLKLAKDHVPTTSIRNGPRYVIICPTRELAQQISEHVFFVANELGLKTGTVFGGMDRYSQIMKMRSGVDVLIATPGRLMDFLKSSKFTLERLEYLTLDEADRILQIGYQEQLQMIASYLPKGKPRQTTFWSATWNSKLKFVSDAYIKPTAQYIQIGENSLSFNSDITQKFEIIPGSEDRVNRLIELIKENPTSKFMIFVNTKSGSNIIADELRNEKIKASKLNGDLEMSQRNHNLSMFKSGVTNVLIATDVASRGLDIKDVTAVINLDIPRDLESYIHRIGRTGRAGNKGTSISFLGDEVNRHWMEQLIQLMEKNNIEVPEEVLKFSDTLSPPPPPYRRRNQNQNNWSQTSREHRNDFDRPVRTHSFSERYSRRTNNDQQNYDRYAQKPRPQQGRSWVRQVDQEFTKPIEEPFEQRAFKKVPGNTMSDQKSKRMRQYLQNQELKF